MALTATPTHAESAEDSLRHLQRLGIGIRKNPQAQCAGLLLDFEGATPIPWTELARKIIRFYGVDLLLLDANSPDAGGFYADFNHVSLNAGDLEHEDWMRVHLHHEAVHLNTTYRFLTQRPSPRDALSIWFYAPRGTLVPNVHPTYSNFLRLDELIAYPKTIRLVEQQRRRHSAAGAAKIQRDLPIEQALYSAVLIDVIHVSQIITAEINRLRINHSTGRSFFRPVKVEFLWPARSRSHVTQVFEIQRQNGYPLQIGLPVRLNGPLDYSSPAQIISPRQLGRSLQQMSRVVRFLVNRIDLNTPDLERAAAAYYEHIFGLGGGQFDASVPPEC